MSETKTKTNFEEVERSELLPQNHQIRQSILRCLQSVEMGQIRSRLLAKIVFFDLGVDVWLSNDQCQKLKNKISKCMQILSERGLVEFKSLFWCLTNDGWKVEVENTEAQEIAAQHQSLVVGHLEFGWVPETIVIKQAIVEIFKSTTDDTLSADYINQELYRQFSAPQAPPWQIKTSNRDDSMRLMAKRASDSRSQLGKENKLFKHGLTDWSVLPPSTEELELNSPVSIEVDFRSPETSLYIEHLHQSNAKSHPMLLKINPHPIKTRIGWRKLAACYGLDSDIFFPETINDKTENHIQSICFNCPVKIDCFEGAMADLDWVGGYRGGVSYQAINVLRNLRQVKSTTDETTKTRQKEIISKLPTTKMLFDKILSVFRSLPQMEINQQDLQILIGDLFNLSKTDFLIESNVGGSRIPIMDHRINTCLKQLKAAEYIQPTQQGGWRLTNRAGWQFLGQTKNPTIIETYKHLMQSRVLTEGNMITNSCLD